MAENNAAATTSSDAAADGEITLLLEAKGGDKYEVKKNIVSCVKFVTGMLEGTLIQFQFHSFLYLCGC